MTTLPPLRDVIAEHGLRAKKSLGQNFLLDEQLLDRIAAIPGDLNDETVYEVGPGPGGLTRALLRAGANVVAVEHDPRCVAALEYLSSAFAGKLKIVPGDAMKIEEADHTGVGAHIVSNLPYNVGTALFVRWLTLAEWPPWWKSLTLMFQKEVAERIVASPDSGSFGRLSVLAQWRSEARIALNVHRSAFVPPPKVASAIVHLTPKSAPAGIDAKTLELLTQTAFGQRRKMLRQSLKSLPGALTALEQADIDARRRPESLSVDEFIAVARGLTPAA